jgi:erythromycin esterase-like protein
MTHAPLDARAMRVRRAHRRVGHLLALAASCVLLAMPSPVPAQGADSLSVVARAARAACDKQVVLLGELPSHGEARGFQAKARIVEWLVDRCGFDAVLFEAPIYDFVGFQAAAAAGNAQPPQLDKAIGRFWWTRELTDWRRWLFRQATEGRLVLGGLDDQVSVTSDYARATLPGLVAASNPPERAAECEQVIARHLFWRYDASHPFDEAEQLRLQRCARTAADASAGRAQHASLRPDPVMLANLASYVDRQRGDSTAPDRDEVMARNVVWQVGRLPAGARVIVWTASVHAARQRGELSYEPLGARLAARWGRRVMAIGFTALAGESSMAGMPSKPLPPLPSGSLEARATGDGARWAFLDAGALRATGRALGRTPSRLLRDVTPVDWSAYFDAVVVMPREVAPTFEAWR